VTEVKGFGRQKGHTELYRGAEYVVDFSAQDQAGSGGDVGDAGYGSGGHRQGCAYRQIGDGKIFVSQIERVIRIRTGEN